MKRLITIALSIGLVAVLALPSHAIDAKKKTAATPSATAPATAKPDTAKAQSSGAARAATNKSLLERLKTDVRESSQKSDTGKYDNYIDSNNDGVDDRVKEKKATAEPEKQKVKSSTPTKDTTPRTRTKKKPG